MLYWEQGRYAEAKPLFLRALGINEKVLGPDHPTVGRLLSNLAALSFAQGDWARAVEYWRRSTALLIRRAQRGATGVNQALTGKSKNEAERSSYQFWGLVRAAHRLATQGQVTDAGLAREMFEMAQWAHGSEAAGSLALMSARGAKGEGALGGLARERQDLVEEWYKRDAERGAALSQSRDKRDRAAEAGTVSRLTAIDARIADIDKRLSTDFPEYAELSRPTPLNAEDVQAHLAADEALVYFLDTSETKPAAEETFIWIVTKTDLRWVRSHLGTAALTREVAALRCGLDATRWYGDEREKCTKTISIQLTIAPGTAEPLPFDHARAHKLYTTLFGEVRDLIKGKHLLIVPSGPLTQLPFQVLVTQPPTSSDHRAIAWLTREQATTVLPAVASLKALRRVGKPSAATRPMGGFGNPLLDGPDARFLERAKLAREKQDCRERPPPRMAGIDLNGGMRLVETRANLTNVSEIKMQVPLPETADELCAVGRDAKAGSGDIRLGTRATEREIKRLSANGELAKYRMLHFATHGVLAGQLDSTHEPGLILTPPKETSEEDDGYLSASEIAGLKLDADWVILSACNTAAGAATSAEALSGLARAFIYAQARALLVSHWEVYSQATVKLITAAIREMAHDPKVGRAEALRRSMLALIDNGDPQEAHPAYWAPFVVVGEGAGAR